MILWRISNYADLKGIGGIEYPGRWHNRGYPVVYLAEHPALAMLEVMVHFDLKRKGLPRRYQLLEVNVPEQLSVQALDQRVLAEGWQRDVEASRAIGDEWLGAQSALLLRVPSAILPHSFNYLLNPRHPEADALKIQTANMYDYDLRLPVELTAND